MLFSPQIVARSKRAPASGSGGGGSGPPGVTGLIGVWDASVTASLSLSGTDILAVADQSGAGNHLTWPGGASTKAVYNATGFNTSYPTIDFSGATAFKRVVLL
jgi:hypothetical protein